MANYNPSKQYTWQKEDVFELSGEDFGLILNTLRGILNTPEATKILLANEANKAIENVMAKAVEQGTVIEVTEEQTSPLRVVKD